MRPQDAHTLRAILAAQLPNIPHVDAIVSVATSTNTAPRPTDEETEVSLHTTSYTMPPPEQRVFGLLALALPTFQPATPTSPPPKEDASGSDEPTSTTPARVEIDSLLKEETCAQLEPVIPTPSTTASPSVRPPSPITFNNWNDHIKHARIKDAKDAHYKRGRIFDKTHQTIRHHTRKMTVFVSRGFERARYVPTKTTKPPLRKRRYSIDVTTKDWDKDSKTYQTHEENHCSYEGDLSPDRTCTCVNVAGDFSQRNQFINNFRLPEISRRYEEYDPMILQAPAASLPNPLRYQHLNVWPAKHPPHDFDEYLTLGDGTLQNFYFNHILTVDGSEAWMDDSSFNMSLEALRLFTDCSAHFIDVVNTNISQVFYMAYSSGDWNNNCYDVYRQRLRNAKWIFVPINDGVGGGSDSSASGSHWSLVVVDRVHNIGFYYDSTGISRFNTIQKVAEVVLKGVLKILQENFEDWTWMPQENSPNQWRNNIFRWDRGPCGPFVWKMASIMIECIKRAQHVRKELACDLNLGDDFPQWFEGQFDSFGVRWAMHNLIAHFKMIMDPPVYIEEHDRAAVAGEDVFMSGKLPAVIAPPPKSVREETVVNDDGDQDGGVVIRRNEQNNTSLVGDDGDLADTLSEGSTIRSEPAEDIMLDDEESMTGIHYGNESYEVTAVDHGQVQPATSRRARPNTLELDEDIGSVFSRRDSQRRRQNIVESDDWSTEETY